MHGFWAQIRRDIKYGILVSIIIWAFALRFTEWVVVGIRRHPQAVLGGNPVGASLVIKNWAKGSVWALRRLRERLGRYVQTYHAGTYHRLGRLFR